jgi:hypothetical protein
MCDVGDGKRPCSLLAILFPRNFHDFSIVHSQHGVGGGNAMRIFERFKIPNFEYRKGSSNLSGRAPLFNFPKIVHFRPSLSRSFFTLICHVPRVAGRIGKGTRLLDHSLNIAFCLRAAAAAACVSPADSFCGAAAEGG